MDPKQKLINTNTNRQIGHLNREIGALLKSTIVTEENLARMCSDFSDFEYEYNMENIPTKLANHGSSLNRLWKEIADIKARLDAEDAILAEDARLNEEECDYPDCDCDTGFEEEEEEGQWEQFQSTLMELLKAEEDDEKVTGILEPFDRHALEVMDLISTYLRLKLKDRFDIFYDSSDKDITIRVPADTGEEVTGVVEKMLWSPLLDDIRDQIEGLTIDIQGLPWDEETDYFELPEDDSAA